jgi:hypothetical protein
VTIDDSSNTYGAQLSSTAAFGGGGYFQATMSYPPGSSGGTFWANDLQNMMGNNGGNWVELDIAENDAITPGSYQIQYHNWYNTDGGQIYGESSPATVPAGTDFSQPHTYGLLWVPATATTQGYIKFYFDGSQVGTTITWNQYMPGQSAQQNPFAVIDSRQISLILGTGGSPTTVSNVQVWQNGTAQDTGTGLTATASGQPCPPVPASAPAASINTLATAATPAPVPANTPAPATQPVAALPNDPTPGEGMATDCSGNVWSVNNDNKILVNGVPVVGGGDTSNLIIQGCQVLGKSNGANGSSTNWFTMNSTSPTTTDGWTVSAAPTGATAGSTAAAAAPATPAPASTAATTTTTAVAPVAVCGSVTASGAFHVAGGQIIGPNGVFIARGLNVYGDQNPMAEVSAAVQSFKGLNFIRYIVRTLDNPSNYQAFVSQFTSQGIVVEFEHHPDGGGGQDLSPPDTSIAGESAWYASMAQTFASNPYVWFGTFNEPGSDGSGALSAWQQSTVNAVRSASNTIVMVEVSGSICPSNPKPSTRIAGR